MVIMFFTILFVLVNACVIDFVESVVVWGDKINCNADEIHDVPTAMWWTINTMCTVGYGDYLPKTILGRILGSITLILGILLLSLPVALISNKFQELHTKHQKAEHLEQKAKTKAKLQATNQDQQKELYLIMLRIYELEEVNLKIEKHLQESQFYYRSLMRDAQNLIDKIEMDDENRALDKTSSSMTKEEKRQGRVRLIMERIQRRRQNKVPKKTKAKKPMQTE
eukprot:TRINITY_DN12559_c0_g1_i1.p1 TRINITY_DN12559_c0_g1~~TRINITY_DN12559_c0_g1_i1.p1  ORF type:complete len:224 (+),score=43.69 TRINITY_DN12559_c0_g1_i1:115-786(+)